MFPVIIPPAYVQPDTLPAEQPVAVSAEQPAAVSAEQPAAVSSEQPVAVSSEQPVAVSSEQPDAVTPGAAPGLGAALRADFEALQNDFEQANAMTVDLQCQLAGKTNEFAQLKHVFLKTSQDLVNLQAGIAELREERHRLANEAMRATALEHTMAAVSGERDKLKLELETLRVTHASTLAEANLRESERETRIQQLCEELKTAKTQKQRPPLNQARGGQLTHPRMASILRELSESVSQLQEMVEDAENRPQTSKSPQEPDFIAISFQT